MLEPQLRAGEFLRRPCPYRRVSQATLHYARALFRRTDKKVLIMETDDQTSTQRLLPTMSSNQDHHRSIQETDFPEGYDA